MGGQYTISIFYIYIKNGNDPSKFIKWVDNFKGQHRPLDDLSDYLKDIHEIRIVDLQQEYESVPTELRHAVKEAWTELHETRRQRTKQFADNLSIIKLAEHDSENYLGIMKKHNDSKERENPMGYTSWWLTLDKAAFSMYNKVKGTKLSSHFIISSPVMSPDFLINYLAIGPNRRHISKEQESILPILLELRITDVLTKDLVLVAEKVRNEYNDLPERTIKRKVRDKLDEERRRLGHIAIGGFTAIEADLLSNLTSPQSSSSINQ
ncbi:hypothetical protein [Hymenobacter crusticola]|uniref:hypothetical protein n=1 Tax=Hymenobacter crusticola TaxID=1770526 RepID=UPI00117A4553|nr:hypothetical protein [Hymenobacter crusticola]